MLLRIIEAIPHEESLFDRMACVIRLKIRTAPSILVDQGTDPDTSGIQRQKMRNNFLQRQTGIKNVFHDKNVLVPDIHGKIGYPVDFAR